MPLTVRFLRWCDVDPAWHPFDPGPARERVAERVLAAVGRAAPEHGDDALEASVDRAVVGACGAWASGWWWAASESGGGGPVRGWCCARDSLHVATVAEAEASIDRVMAALSEWRAFLEELASLYAELRATLADGSLEDRVERAAARLLPLVVRRTGADDAWYGTFDRVLSWYLESAGLDPDVFGDAVNAVISGRFESWIEPSTETARDACAELGFEVALAVAEPAPSREALASRDALAAWRSVRGRLAEHAIVTVDRDPVGGDAHRRFIEGPERARDPERAARMGAALDACRASARLQQRLTFERLAAWQALVLGGPAPFRTGDAYAKGGRERYGLLTDTRRHFEAALGEANGDGDVAVRAARVYLDVCFFHPFADGNARAARLALDHVITRAGFGLHAVEPLFVVSRSVHVEHLGFAWLVDHLLGPRLDRVS